MTQELSLKVNVGDHIDDCLEEARILALVGHQPVTFIHNDKAYVVTPEEAKQVITPEYISKRIELLYSNFLDTTEDAVEDGIFYSLSEYEVTESTKDALKSTRLELTRWQGLRRSLLGVAADISETLPAKRPKPVVAEPQKM